MKGYFLVACFLASACCLASANDDEAEKLTGAIYSQVYSPVSKVVVEPDDVHERLTILEHDYTEKLQHLRSKKNKKAGKARHIQDKEILHFEKRLISVKDYVGISESNEDKCNRIYLNHLESLVAYAPSKNLKNYAIACKRQQYFLCEDKFGEIYESDKKKLQDIKQKLDLLMDKINEAARNHKHFDIYVDGSLDFLESVLSPEQFRSMTTKKKFKKVFKEEVRDLCLRAKDTLMPVIELLDYKSRDPSMADHMTPDTFDWINKWKMCNEIISGTDQLKTVPDLAYLHYKKKVPKKSFMSKITDCFGGRKKQAHDD